MIASPRDTTAGRLPDRRPLRQVVSSCYSVVDRFFPACGLFDLTEGIYHGDPALPLEQAQANQLEFLLDAIQCRSGSRVLEIGCGYGTLLRRVEQRRATGIGITISAPQVRRCRRRGLDARLLDYRDIPADWDRSFDAVVANGSIEHFVHPEDVAAGRADEVYRDLFATAHRVMDPRSPARRFATTAIHVLRPPRDPLALLRPPSSFPAGSDDFHWAVLEQGWGGYYPEPGQLRRCAMGYFELIDEVDGTDDYRLTSEEWLRRIRAVLRTPRLLSIGLRSLPVFLRAPRQFITLLRGLLASQSWNWQFRPPDPPTRLLRQTWEYCDRD